MTKVNRLSDEELLNHKANLLNMKEETLQLIASERGIDLNKNGTDETGKSKNSLHEIAADSYNQETNGAILRAQYEKLGHINEALVSVENKTYGVDKVTGQFISPERLRKCPLAKTNIDTKGQSNSNKEVRSIGVSSYAPVS